VSDASNSQGWWQSEDGRWYPPPRPGSDDVHPSTPAPPQPPPNYLPPPPPPPYTGSPTDTFATCGQCGTPVADHIVYCPNCSSPIKRRRFGSGQKVGGQTAKVKVKKKWVAVVLAVIFAFWTFLYTFQVDKKRFWTAFAVFVVARFAGGIGGFVDLGIWVWSIVMASRRPESFYTNYPNE